MMFVSRRIQKIVVNLRRRAPPPAHVRTRACLCVCVWEQERAEGVNEQFSVSEVSEPRVFDFAPWRPGEFPLQFLSAEPTLGQESHARKIYVDVSNENTAAPRLRRTIFVKQRSVHSFALSVLLRTLVLLFRLVNRDRGGEREKNVNARLTRAIGLPWLVASAGTAVSRLSSGPLRDRSIWARLLRCYQHIYPSSAPV